MRAQRYQALVPPEEEAEAEEAAEPPADPAACTFGTKIWNDWRCSYRTATPELEQPRQVQRRLAKKTNATKHIRIPNEIGQRHKTDEELKAASKQKAALRKAKLAR